MEIRITYVFKRADGVIGYSCGQMPTGVEILEERPVLYPSEGKELMNIETEERFSAVWLHDGDVQENYIEVDPEPEPEIPEIDFEEIEEEYNAE